MEWERRPPEDTPVAEQRWLEDDQGRRWVGTVTSGDLEGGERRAQVVFVCEDQPSEVKRRADLDLTPEEAQWRWRDMEDAQVVEVFRQSRPA